ncbi:unnamed protein product [Caenorhabditis brenneri]
MSTRQQKVIEDLHNEVESLRNEMAGIKNNQEESVKNEKENGRKRKGEEDGEASSAKKPAPEKSPFLAKHFVIKHKWENLLEMKEGETRTSPEEENFGLTCGIEIVRRADNFETRYFCRKPLSRNDTVQFLWQVKGTLSKSGSVFKHYGNSGTEWSHSFKATELTDWEEKMKTNNGSSYDVEVNFYFKRTSGFYKENLKNFDETMEKFADVVIIVQEQKFFVSKLFLASHSSYFDRILLGPSAQSEIQLKYPDPSDFQKYLEVLYGHPALDDKTVEGVLLVAHGSSTATVKEKCQEFLVTQSKKPLKKKLELFARYNLDQQKIVPAFKTLADVQSLSPEDLSSLDKETLKGLLQTCITSK